MKILGPALGFHVTHVLLFAPCRFFYGGICRWTSRANDRATGSRRRPRQLFATGYSYFCFAAATPTRMGGVVMVMAKVAGTARPRRGGMGKVGAVCGLAVTAYAHPDSSSMPGSSG